MRPAVVLTLLVLAAYAAGSARRAWRLPAGIVLAVVAVAWLRVNSPMEGEVLLTVSLGRGFTAADVGGVFALVLAAFRILVPSFEWAWKQRADPE